MPYNMVGCRELDHNPCAVTSTHIELPVVSIDIALHNWKYLATAMSIYSARLSKVGYLICECTVTLYHRSRKYFGLEHHQNDGIHASWYEACLNREFICHFSW